MKTLDRFEFMRLFVQTRLVSILNEPLLEPPDVQDDLGDLPTYLRLHDDLPEV
jgi:hypothetical protein